MARFKNDPFPGTDYTQYQNWTPVTLPTGEVLYQVPGHPGYVFDPVASNATGRKVFRTNPAATIKQQQDAQAHQDELIKQQEQNASPLGQVTPVLAGTAGAIGASYLTKTPAPAANPLLDALAREKDAATVAKYGQQAVTPQANAAAQGATQISPNPQSSTGLPGSKAGDYTNLPNATPQTPGEFGGGNDAASYDAIPGGTQPTATLAPGEAPPAGTTLAPNGAVVNTTGQTVGRWVQGVGGAVLIYQGVQDFKNDKVGGTLKVGAGATNVAAAYGGAGSAAATYVPYVNTALGAYDTYQGFQHGGTGLRTGTTELGAGIGSFFGPLGTVIGAAAGNATGYAIKNENNWKGRLLEGPQLGLLRHFTGLSLGDLIHKTTKQVQDEHTSDLAKLDPDAKNTDWQNILAARAQATANGPADPSKPFAGKYATFDEYKKAGLDANDLSKAYGVLKSVGPDYTKYTPAQIQQYTQTLIDNNLFESKKGEVVVTDDDKAKALKDQILGVTTAPLVDSSVTPQANAAANGAVAVQLPAQQFAPSQVASAQAVPRVSNQAMAAAQGASQPLVARQGQVAAQVSAAPLMPPPEWIWRNGQIIRKS